jgi:prepilin-type N-terminal cleavage/methylation domain-containing protein
MRWAQGNSRQSGFTLIELLVALGIFLIVTGAAFTLLGSSQKRYQTESQVLTSFQEARLGLDQIVRDVNDSGYPPPTFNSGFPNLYASTPFAWSPGYSTNNPCLIVTGGVGPCVTPGDFDLIIETNPNPQDPICAPNCPVQWIRYQLPPGGTTLMRGVVNKSAGGDPAADTSAAGVLVPFVQNVVNITCPAQIPTCQSAYPGLFPGGNPVPIFSYICDTPTAPQSPAPLCSNAVADNSPANIRDVTVTLIVGAPLPDATTGQPRLVVLNGRGRRVNPNQ